MRYQEQIGVIGKALLDCGQIAFAVLDYIDNGDQAAMVGKLGVDSQGQQRREPWVSSIPGH